jgi:hypothetical protein
MEPAERERSVARVQIARLPGAVARTLALIWQRCIHQGFRPGEDKADPDGDERPRIAKSSDSSPNAPRVMLGSAPATAQ